MGSDAGTINVRFTVANAEVVRQALANLGKDGQKALQQFDRSADPANKSLNVLGDVVDLVRGRANSLAGAGGGVATMLLRWGPAGIVAGASLGGLYLGLSKLTDIAEKFGEKTQMLRDNAQTLGQTTLALQAYIDAGGKVGVAQEKIIDGLGRFTVGLEQLRNGQGKLKDELDKLDPGLVEQLARTRDNAKAIDLLAEAYDKATTSTQKNAIAAAAAGKGNLEFGRFLVLVRQAGGSAGLAAAFAPEAIPNETIERIARIRVEIGQIGEKTGNILGQMFTERVLEVQRLSAEQLHRIAQTAAGFKLSDDFKSLLNPDSGGLSSWSIWPRLLQILPILQELQSGIPGVKSENDLITQKRKDLAAGLRAGQRFDLSGIYQPAQPKPDESLTSAFQLAAMRERIALLGSAATQTEQLRLKELEAAVATNDWRKHQDAANRGIDAFKFAQMQANAAIRERLALGSQSEMLAVRLVELRDMYAKSMMEPDVNKRMIKSDEELAAAERLVRKEVKETYEAMQLRQSATPNLTKLSQDAGDLSATLDQNLAGALRGMSSEFSILNRSTDSLGDRIKNLSLRFVDAAIQAAAMKTVIGPMANSFSSLLSGGVSGLLKIFGSADGNVFNGRLPQPFAAGGVLTRPVLFPLANGGIAAAGEAGPEAILPLRRGRNGRLGVDMTGLGSGGPAALYQTTNYNDFRDADPEAVGRIERRIGKLEKQMQVMPDAVNQHRRTHPTRSQ